MDKELLKAVDKYLVGAQALRDLAGSVAEVARTVLQSNDQHAIELLNQLEADLVDVSEGLLSEESFREQWEARTRIARTHSLEFLPGGSRQVTASNAVTLRFRESYAHSERAA